MTLHIWGIGLYSVVDRQSGRQNQERGAKSCDQSTLVEQRKEEPKNFCDTDRDVFVQALAVGDPPIDAPLLRDSDGQTVYP
jgi:hypothetical protein